MPSGPSGTLRTGGPGVLSVICVGSLSGQALPPPTGIAAWPSGSLRTGAGGVFRVIGHYVLLEC